MATFAEITRNFDHVAEGLNRLLTQFHDRPNFAGVVSSLAGQIQELETVAWQLLTERTLTAAVGVQLDGLGGIVGEVRAGRLDLDYRAAIRGRIRRNRAHGRTEDLIHLIRLLMPAATSNIQDGPGPATITVELDTGFDPVTDPSPEEVHSTMEKGAAGGVSLRMFYSLFDNSLTFTTADAAVLQIDSNRGTGDVAQTTGGRLAGIIS